jgi:acyl-coenzyme A thioesterase PaaI-like protein
MLPEAAELSPHHDACYVCGPGNPASTGLRLRSSGGGIIGELVLDDRHQGVPGLAHGGAIAALMDEVSGSVLIEAGHRFVTAQLDVTYLAPAAIGQPLVLRAWLDRSEGRKHTVKAELREAGLLLAQATGLFLTVPADHFTAVGASAGSAAVFGEGDARRTRGTRNRELVK